MTAAISAQIAAAKASNPAEPTPVARTDSKAPQHVKNDLKQPPPPGTDTPKEQPRPAGHRARYASSKGGGLSYAGHRWVADDLTDHQKDTITRAAVSVGVQPYQ